MAKELPYFKFRPTEWLTGDIVFEDMETQGLFTNICAVYWQRDGDLTLEDVEKRYKNYGEKITAMVGRFLKIKKGKIKISFLDEQFLERGFVSEKNSENGKLGGRPKKQVVTPKLKKATALIEKPKKSNKEGEIEEEGIEIKKKREREDSAPELQYQYMIGDEEILSIEEVLKEKFPIKFNTACYQYGEFKIKKWITDFGNLHKQKTWKDYEDFRAHISRYFVLMEQNHNDNKKINPDKKGKIESEYDLNQRLHDRHDQESRDTGT
jgi:hypothetical protein